MIKWKYTGDTKIYTGVKKIPPEKAVKIFVFPIAFFCIMCYNTAMNKKNRTHEKNRPAIYQDFRRLDKYLKYVPKQHIEVRTAFFICSEFILPRMVE